MAFDPNQIDRLTAAGRAQAKLDEFESEAKKHAMYQRVQGAPRPRRWLVWLTVGAIVLGVAYLLLS
jgi:hypothetical protein